MITQEDINGIIREAEILSRGKYGINHQIVTALIKEAITIHLELQQKDVGHLFGTLHPTEGYIESFQQRKKVINTNRFLKQNERGFPRTTLDDGYSIFYDEGGREIRSSINKEFGTTLGDNDRGWGRVYLLLLRLDNENGMMYCYGETHLDRTGRHNMNFFYVVAEYQNLSLITELFLSNPDYLAVFVNKVFGWQNGPEQSPEPNLFQHMKSLFVKTPELGIKAVAR